MSTAPAQTPAADYSAYAEPVSSDKLAQLAVLAAEQTKLEHDITQAKQEVAKMEQALATLSERTLPELMDELGMEEFSTNTGLRVKIQEAIRASIPKTRLQEALDWLDQKGLGKIIKREFSVLFGKDEEAWARKFARDLQQRKKALNVTESASVHNQTLCALVRERLKAGEEMPVDLFGIYRQRYSKIEVKR